MKRVNVLFSLALVLTTLLCLVGIKVSATAEHGTLKLTFVRNEVSDDAVVFHNWNRGTNAPDPVITKDGIFINAEFAIMEDANDEMGIIPALDSGDGTPDWDNKLSYGGADLLIDVTDIKGSGVKHAFIYEDAKAGEVTYSTTDESNYLMLLSYYAPTYEENIGVHSWGDWLSTQVATGWGMPVELFKTIGRAPDGSEIKGAILEATNTVDTGALIYAGTDDSKKHSAFGDLVFAEDAEVGVPQFMGVGNGNVYTSDEGSEYIEDVFSLKFVQFGVASNGSYFGTYAVNSKTVLASLSSTITIPKIKVEETDETEEVLYTEEERINLAKELFIISETDTDNKITIDSIDFDKNADSVKDFVFTLTDTLDASKSYTIYYKDESKECSIEIDLDKESPVITLLRGKDVIDVEWGEPFDMKNFPQYEASDDRDGDITAKVYVPSGKGILDTSVEGDYEVTLCVKDSWGNVTEKVITFRVSK